MSLAEVRPRSAAEIVDATFQFYRNNFATVVTLAAIIIVPPAILKVVAPAAFERVIGIAINLLSAICQGSIAAMVGAAVERGECLDVGAALRSTRGRRDSLMAAQVETGLLIFIGLVLLVVPGFIAAIWTAVAIPVVMFEQLGYAKAISRSGALSRGRWKHVLGTLLLSWGLVVLLSVGGGVVIGMLNIPARMTNLIFDLAWAVIVPIPAIAVTLLYYDLRVRNESADLDAILTRLPAFSPASS